MKALNYSEFRQNLKTSLDEVYENHEPLIVTRKHNQNMVVLSEEDYSSLMETVYLLSSKNNANRLLESIEQVKKEEKVSFDFSQLEEE